jgi:hypothetical protein
MHGGNVGPTLSRPPPGKVLPHYSGSLPVMATNAPELDRVYYMAVASLLSCERTNLPIVAPRVYLTGAGNAFAEDAQHVWSIGGTTQFALGCIILRWDCGTS